MSNIIKNIFIAFKEYLLLKKENKTPRLIMTLLVKNEEVLLEQNILFHKAMGVDAFIVTDNNSQDRTPQIIQKYIDKGWIIESFVDHDTKHLQKKKVDKMIMSAKYNHGADWVINCDADEFWCSPQGDLKSEMQDNVNILRCKSVNMYPEEGVNFMAWDKVTKPIPTDNKYNLSLYNLFNRYSYKVAHTTSGFIKISMGNHKVTMFPIRKKESKITIFHYSVMSKESFIRKTANTRPYLKYKKNKKKSESRHWKYFCNLYLEGKLDAEYNKIIGSEYFEEFQKLGYIYHDNSVANVLKSISKQIK